MVALSLRPAALKPLLRALEQKWRFQSGGKQKRERRGGHPQKPTLNPKQKKKSKKTQGREQKHDKKAGAHKSSKSGKHKRAQEEKKKMEKLAGFLVGARLYPDVYARDLVDVYARDSSNMLASFKQAVLARFSSSFTGGDNERLTKVDVMNALAMALREW